MPDLTQLALRWVVEREQTIAALVELAIEQSAEIERLRARTHEIQTTMSREVVPLRKRLKYAERSWQGWINEATRRWDCYINAKDTSVGLVELAIEQSERIAELTEALENVCNSAKGGA